MSIDITISNENENINENKNENENINENKNENENKNCLECLVDYIELFKLVHMILYYIIEFIQIYYIIICKFKSYI